MTGGGERGPIERELKFRVPDLDALRDRVEEEGGERLHPAAFEDNLVWDREGQLRAERCVLRLRRDRRGVRLTFKGPPTMRSGVKERLEHEVSLGGLDADPGSQADAMGEILRALGFAVSRRYQKVREEWRLGESEVVLDRTPMGDFVEFEGADAERQAERCDLEPTSAESGNYLELWERYRESHPEAPEDMVFEGDPKREAATDAPDGVAGGDEGR
jgi:adenylate cyclase class IV